MILLIRDDDVLVFVCHRIHHRREGDRVEHNESIPDHKIYYNNLTGQLTNNGHRMRVCSRMLYGQALDASKRRRQGTRAHIPPSQLERTCAT